MKAPAPVETLLRSAIDYAGLFPPAGLPMADAVRNYQSYRRSDDAWALGRFVLPGGRLAEWAEAVESLTGPRDVWPLAVTVPTAAALRTALESLAAVTQAGGAIEVAEAPTPDPAAVFELAAVAGGLRWYAEVPSGPALGSVLDAVAAARGRAKIRMGGVTPDAFPAPAAVARFLVEAAARSVPFKATAGLHHPVGGRYRLTYDEGAPEGRMYGYLDLAVAATLAAGGADASAVERILAAERPAPVLRDDGIGWAGQRVETAAIDRLRTLFDGFGSCSFREPIDEIAALQ